MTEGCGVFIHSSWRTSSTWLWQQFRHLPETLCFYEPFNEDLSTMSRQRLAERGVDSWRSGHARTAPYFLEFTPLARKGGGVRLHRPQFAYDWFIPSGGLTGSLRREEIRYVALLLRRAERDGRTPVLGFTRSLGRITPLKQVFGGAHIFLFRNLWGQWMSFLDQKRKGEPFFCAILRVIADQPEDRFLRDIHNFYFRRCMELAADHGVLPKLAGVPSGRLTRLVFDLLPEGEMFEMFMAIHVYLYLHAAFSCDVLIDSTELSRNPDYARQCEADLRRSTGLCVDLSAGAQKTQRVAMVNGAVDWRRILQHARLAAAHLQAFHERAHLDRLADRLLGAALAESEAEA
jgi:hypothetical protein